MYPELESRLKQVRPELNIAKQGIKVKFADFQQTTVEHSQAKLDKAQFVGLLNEALTRQKDREIRLIGLSVGLEQGSRHSSCHLRAFRHKKKASLYHLETRPISLDTQ